jgi:hypothetical protein
MNSNEELEKYIICTEGNYPAINFAKHSLLLASGKQSGGVFEVNIIDLQQHSSNKFSLNVEITLCDTIVNKLWRKAFVVKKMSEESKVRLNTTFKEQEIVYPIDVPYVEYSLEGTQCQWQNIPCNHKVIAINSNEELEKYISCAGGSYPEIDFDKRTLLLVSGFHQIGVLNTTLGKLEHLAPHNYKLDVTVNLDWLSPKKGWSYMVSINKLHNESIVELNLTTIAYNIRRLLQYPLEVIQATVLGKWQVTDVWLWDGGGAHFVLDNTFANITSDSFSVFGIEDKLHWPFDSDYFSYSWKKKPVYNAFNQLNSITYVIQNIKDNRYGIYFEYIFNDVLRVTVISSPEDCDFLFYDFVRIKN